MNTYMRKSVTLYEDSGILLKTSSAIQPAGVNMSAIVFAIYADIA